MAGAPPGAVQAGGYEFAPYESAILGRTGARARTWGIISIILGALMFVVALAAMLLGGVPGLLAGGGIAVVALVPLITGKFYIDAGNALALVVQTQGNDIAHALQGVAKLRSAFRIESIVTIVAFVIGVALALVLPQILGAMAG